VAHAGGARASPLAAGSHPEVGIDRPWPLPYVANNPGHKIPRTEQKNTKTEFIGTLFGSKFPGKFGTLPRGTEFIELYEMY
jgi:hypothetical protein